jgi:hypothetical protein
LLPRLVAANSYIYYFLITQCRLYRKFYVRLLNILLFQYSKCEVVNIFTSIDIDIEAGLDEKASSAMLEECCSSLSNPPLRNQPCCFTCVPSTFQGLEATEYAFFEMIFVCNDQSDLTALEMLRILQGVGSLVPFILMDRRLSITEMRAAFPEFDFFLEHPFSTFSFLNIINQVRMHKLSNGGASVVPAAKSGYPPPPPTSVASASASASSSNFAAAASIPLGVRSAVAPQEATSMRQAVEIFRSYVDDKNRNRVSRSLFNLEAVAELLVSNEITRDDDATTIIRKEQEFLRTRGRSGSSAHSTRSSTVSKSSGSHSLSSVGFPG